LVQTRKGKLVHKSRELCGEKTWKGSSCKTETGGGQTLLLELLWAHYERGEWRFAEKKGGGLGRGTIRKAIYRLRGDNLRREGMSEKQGDEG